MAEISLKSIIIGMMAFILFIMMSFAIMVDMYSVDNLNIDLSEDNSTSALAELQTIVEEQQAQIQEDNKYIDDRVVGGSETELGKDVSNDNLVASSLTALSNTPSYIATFFKLFSASINALGRQIGGALAIAKWFFVVALSTIIAFLLLGSVLQRSP